MYWKVRKFLFFSIYIGIFATLWYHLFWWLFCVLSAMSGLYLHIPFCKKICAYCDFFRVADLRAMEPTLRAMHEEMDAERDFLSDSKLRTIYFGGGTPSLVAPSQIASFIEHADKLWGCGDVEELTLEANPDDINKEFVSELRATPINRISLGVQSFDDDELLFMNRRHTSAEAVDAVKRLQDSGLENITIDLIFGVDGFDNGVLSRSVEQAIALGVQHISAYHLTIEPRTLFYKRLQCGEMCEVAEEVSQQEFKLVHDMLTAAGFEHYEVSNYALKGYRARHNSSYWHGAQYLGIGPGAHSYNGEIRRWSEQSVGGYCVRREYESEKLSEIDHRNEYIMTSLRCAEGIDTEYFKTRFGEQALMQVMGLAQRWTASGDLCFEQGWLKIPARRFLISDAIIESLFEV